MPIAHTHRQLIAWLLYSCVLFSTFACAIGHGQSSGLQLSGIEQLQCSLAGVSDPQLPSLSHPPVTFDCPLCSSHGLTGNLSGYHLQLSAWQPAPLCTATTAYNPPRPTLWASARPRAPPTL